MDTKDYFTIGISIAALIFSLLSIYFAHFHKPSGAMLSLVYADYSPAKLSGERVIEKSKRHLRYCISNTGRQSLYVREISMLRGPSVAGNLKDARSFWLLTCNKIEPFVLNPGEVVPFDLVHDEDYSDKLKIVEGLNHFEMVSVELLSADGMRYQMCHNITRMPRHGIHVSDPLLNGVHLGRPVDSVWYV